MTFVPHLFKYPAYIKTVSPNASANCNCVSEKTMGKSGMGRAVFAMRGMLQEWFVSARFAQILLVLLIYKGLVGLFHIQRLL